MKRITLVNPSEGFSKGFVPLGLASISAYLKKYGTDIEVRLLDADCQDIYHDFTPDTDVVAITAVTQDIKRATEFAKFVKSYGNIPVILGGVHITTFRILPEPFDVGVVGEGEETMLELMQLSEIKNLTIGEIKGVCFNVFGKTYFTEPRPLIINLDIIPIPDRDIANMEHYLKPQQIIPYYKGCSLTIMSSRGCPFKCVFCSTQIHWQKFRAFSAERVVEEIELLINKYQVEIIHIFDDLFITDKKRLARIHDLIIEKGINKQVKILCLVRSDLIDDKTMQMLKEMNVVGVCIGMESGCLKTLEYLKQRTVTIEKNREAIKLANKYNIPIMGSFMIGNPYETEEEMMQTLAFIREHRYTPYLSPLTYVAAAFPGTEFWKYAKAKGLPDDFENISMDIPNDIESLKKGSLLTDVPVERFFEISRLFLKETKYGVLKQKLFNPSWFDYIAAYKYCIVDIEGNLFTGISEVNKIRREFKKYRNREVS
jgi:anaerobic magnesium-protoporphyrin IX monomethyl ester cyclase